ncbi:MAG: CinA family protein [Candidatus Margulisbacteria bacterium]|nr:CinA family protein [Candidatus Margulisiibacteriota bacterium]MBU1617664.1 CinA family protein [Candidatus Margulisiibacteriota bacterium]MBU1867380.1 CinA family protein [Candidatus Margulisiibacteriota bacterium]
MAERTDQTVENNLNFFSQVLSALGRNTDQQVTELLREQRLTISVAESLTGGLISSRLTSMAGSSDFFTGGIVCYSTRTKVSQVGVSPALISQFGVVSREVAVALAEEIRKRFKSDIGLGATGVAGPDPIPPAPVGKVFVAVASNNGTDWKELNIDGKREEIREKTAAAALGLLWLHLGGEIDKQ